MFLTYFLWYKNLDIIIRKKEIIVKNPNQIRRLLTANKTNILMFLRNNYVSSIRDLARKINRDYKNVYKDLKELEKLGLVKLKKIGKNVVLKVLFDEVVVRVILNSSKEDTQNFE